MRWVLLACIWWGAVLTASAWEPGGGDSDATGSPAAPLVVDAGDRNDVLSFYHCIFAASERASDRMGWTGSIAACDPGSTSATFRDDVQRRVNYYRAMAGVPGDVVFEPSFNTDSQAAAMLMSERGGLSHNPSSTWGASGCWSPEAQNGAGQGNLALGVSGPRAISVYIEDDGSNNTQVGHRRWILYPQITRMGTGDVPSSGGAWNAANCLYVIDPVSYRSSTSEFTAWPPPGYVPASEVYERWSLQFNTPESGYPRYGNAVVKMCFVDTGEAIPVGIDYRYVGGSTAADGAVVWVPNWSAYGGAPPVERAIKVTVSGITSGGSGAPATHSYVVTPIDSDVVTDPLNVQGPVAPPASGASYTFSRLGGVGADFYQIGVAKLDGFLWEEGAEVSPSPRVIDGTSSSYSLTPVLVPAFGGAGAHSGSRSFHLTFPNFEETEQSFEIDRTSIVGAASRLQFYDLFRFSTSGSRLSAEISVDGAAWEEVWARSGNNAHSTSGWVKSWAFRDIDVSEHEGKSLRVRFRYIGSGSIFASTDIIDGVFIDKVTVTDSGQLGDERVTEVPGTASGFFFDAVTAGGDLSVGTRYFLRVRPVMGCKTFPFGAAKAVTVSPAASGGFDLWLSQHVGAFPEIGFTEDPDGDGISNGVEYAFGTDPARVDSLPGLGREGDTLRLRFDPAALPYDTSDIIYSVEYSGDFTSWEPLEDSGSLGVLVFDMPDGGQGFARWGVTFSP